MTKEVIETVSDSLDEDRSKEQVGGEPETVAPHSASSDNSYFGPERRKDPETQINLDEIDYFPMFWSSVQAAALTLLLQFLIPMYLALQIGLDVELRLWNRVLPYFGVRTDPATFNDIVFWSSVGTAIVLGAFSIIAFWPGRSLRVRFGRLFAWLNISLMALLLLNRHLFLNIERDHQIYMWTLLATGLLGFLNGSLIIRIQYKERLERLNA